MAALILVLGGARSGKSRMAESLITEMPGPWTYIATAQALDAEMRDRIRHHRADRAPGWVTAEEPLELLDVLSIADRSGRPILVDCLTLWLTNLMLGDHDWRKAGQDLLASLPLQQSPVVFVTNEVGMGIVPDNALARAFRDAAGTLNQWVAAAADEVILAVSGLPLKVK